MAEPKNTDKDGAVEGETKRESFVRLAERRVSTVVTGYARLEQLARPANYEYGPEDIDKIESALNSAHERTIKALREGKVAPAQTFTL